MDNCLLCRFNDQKQSIAETASWFVDIPREFKFPGLYFIRLKRHAEQLGELTEEESSQLGGLIQKYSKKSKDELKADRVLALSLGFSDPHIHFWILPKTEENRDDVLLLREAMRSILKQYRG